MNMLPLSKLKLCLLVLMTFNIIILEAVTTPLISNFHWPLIETVSLMSTYGNSGHFRVK